MKTKLAENIKIIKNFPTFFLLLTLYIRNLFFCLHIVRQENE